MKKIILPFGFSLLVLCLSTVQAQINSALSAIGGPTDVCPGSTITYTAAKGATYSWVTAVGTIVGSNEGASVNIKFPNKTFSNQNVCAYDLAKGKTASPECITVSGTQAQVGPISGPDAGVCSKANQQYSVPYDAAVTTYAWTVPAGATIQSGQGLSQLVVQFSNTYYQGTISVTASYRCATSKSTFLVKGAPPIPVVSPGPGPYCGNSGDTYRASSTNVSSYLWTFSYPLEKTNIITKDSSQLFVTWSNGPGSVQARNGCGLSDPLKLKVISCD